jgi:hypothetical protein
MRVGFARAGLHQLVVCFHCMSFWVSLLVVLIFYELHVTSILLVFGLAGAASLTERFLEVSNNEEEENDD